MTSIDYLANPNAPRSFTYMKLYVHLRCPHGTTLALYGGLYEVMVSTDQSLEEAAAAAYSLVQRRIHEDLSRVIVSIFTSTGEPVMHVGSCGEEGTYARITKLNEVPHGLSPQENTY